VNEVGQHAHYWDESDDFHEAPKGEEDTENHLVVVVLVPFWLCLDFLSPSLPEWKESNLFLLCDALMILLR